MRQRELLAYATQQLPTELQLMQTGGYATAHPHLTPAEKALVYHYSDTGFEALNAQLHASGGRNSTDFGQGLAMAVHKLPPYRGLVRSAVHLTPQQVLYLQSAESSEAPFRWPAFLSASRSPSIAEWHLRMAGPGMQEKNCLFLITSRTGRSTELLSEYGPHGSKQNEQEVLFLPGTEFYVRQITRATSHYHIVLQEA